MIRNLLTTIFVIFTFAFTTAAFAANTTVGDTPLLYVREGCPHCANVKAFLSKNNLNDKVKIIETYNNDANQKELNDWFNKLGVTDPNQMGVPFMIVNESSKEYYVGDQPIINYFANKYNITVTEPTYQSSTSDSIFLGIGGLVLFAVLGYGIYSSFKKKD